MTSTTPRLSHENEPAAGTASTVPLDEATSFDNDFTGMSLAADITTVPRTAAVQKFANALVTHAGMGEGIAYAVARAAVRPDEARRRLAFPVAERVPGGTIYSITVPVFSSAITTYPVNLREAVDRRYAFSGVGHDDERDYPSLSQVTSELGETAEVVVRARSREHVIASLNRSQAFLRKYNTYEDSIGVNGVLKEVYAVAIRIDHADGSDSEYALGSADGSSRIGSCHRLTGATPEQIVYAWTADDRRWRNALGRDLALIKQPFESLTSEEQRKIRALVIPAKIAIRYEPDPGSELTFAQAVRFIVGLTHVDPPTKWDKASELDALAEAALDELVRQRRITDDEARYLGGDLTPEDASVAGFPPRPDQRAAYIYKKLLSKANLPVTKRGIRRVTAKASVRYTAAADVAVELALRAWRPTLTVAHASQADAVRSASQRAMCLSEIHDHAWALTGRLPEQLRAAALKELAEGVQGGPAALELAVLASWYLLVGQHMRRELSSSPDKRSLDKVLRSIMTSERGIHQLAQALADGRAGDAVRPVDEEGTPTVEQGQVHDRWIREVWGEQEEVELNLDDEHLDTPETLLRKAQDRVAELAERLVTAVEAVSLVRGARRMLIVEQGWASHEVDEIVKNTDKVVKDLRKWAAIHDASMIDREDGEDLQDDRG